MISLIAAIGKNRELGLGNAMLWHIKEDFKHFKETTMGHTLLMGRKTFESIGRPLPGRHTLILTRDRSFKREGTHTVHSFEEALKWCEERGEEHLFIAGGGEIYKQALERNLEDQLILSYVDFEGEADTFFPEFNESEYDLIHKSMFAAGEKSPAWELRVLKTTPHH
jgi:dihydrofolate reductase